MACHLLGRLPLLSPRFPLPRLMMLTLKTNVEMLHQQCWIDTAILLPPLTIDVKRFNAFSIKSLPTFVSRQPDFHNEPFVSLAELAALLLFLALFLFAA